MKWVEYNGDPNVLRALPKGTIIRCIEEERYNYKVEKIELFVLGDGWIHNNYCDKRPEGWRFTTPESIEAQYDVLEYALPPQEYLDFYKEVSIA